MKALTLWQPWASLVAIGVKRFEFRKWRAPAAIVGERIVIHASKRAVDMGEVNALTGNKTLMAACLGTFDEAELEFARDYLRGQDGCFPLGCGLAEATLGTPRRAIDLFRTHVDPDDIDPDVWGWPMESVEEWHKPVPARGRQGFWEWQPEPQLFEDGI